MRERKKRNERKKKREMRGRKKRNERKIKTLTGKTTTL